LEEATQLADELALELPSLVWVEDLGQPIRKENTRDESIGDRECRVIRQGERPAIFRVVITYNENACVSIVGHCGQRQDVHC
jgi:hypothetical protein